VNTAVMSVLQYKLLVLLSVVNWEGDLSMISLAALVHVELLVS